MKIERRRNNRYVEVYTASLNDIMFFLLLFFLIISTMITPAAIRVLLPNASASEQIATKKNIHLVVTKNLEYFINDKKISKEEVEPALLAEATKAQNSNEEINVLLQADKNLSLQDVVDIIDIGNKLQIKMVLFTQKPK